MGTHSSSRADGLLKTPVAAPLERFNGPNCPGTRTGRSARLWAIVGCLSDILVSYNGSRNAPMVLAMLGPVE